MRRMIDDKTIRRRADGSVVINNAVLANEDGDVEVGKNLEVDGKLFANGMSLTPHYYNNVFTSRVSEIEIREQTTYLIGNLAYCHVIATYTGNIAKQWAFYYNEELLPIRFDEGHSHNIIARAFKDNSVGNLIDMTLWGNAHSIYLNSALENINDIIDFWFLIAIENAPDIPERTNEIISAQEDLGIVELTVPEGAKQGTMTHDQMRKLASSDLIEIKIGTDRYHISADHSSEGYKVYAAHDVVDGTIITKALYITLSTGAFSIINA